MLGYRIEKVISGGQTGVDQLALTVAQNLGIKTGGVAPKGYLTENGPAPWLAGFGLVEDSSSKYPPRTRRNVVESDATVIFGSPTNGTELTINCCTKAGVPYILNPTAPALEAFIVNHGVQILNVAGNRKSKMTPDQEEKIRTILTLALQKLNHI
ncbi:YpsA SLOG family protein [Larkinella humicola]|uniref:Molybdenum carrier protein n=1 Tax=Larkinella humicola TaxID=2607654 RepID=A0A5N1JK81_9BACT|nr:putative molybdenum carrier protein [Larkinella humicola]KAA9356865.1 hypothetical protein F0P93_03750 [Larkinella humicola]